MFDKLNTILLVGGTGGLGEGWARAFHGLGKTVIITGRRTERLEALQKELPGLKTYQWDVTDLSALSHHTSTLLNTYPDIDAVFINSGIQRHFDWADPNSSSDKLIIDEVTTNVTAPYLSFRAFYPHLHARAASGKPAALLATSSGLAFLPAATTYPVYNATKAAMHSALVTMRGGLKFAPEAVQENLNIVEVAPPRVATDLDVNHKETVTAIVGGPKNDIPAMPLDEYINNTMEGFSKVGEDGKMLKEIGMGFSQMGIDAWRKAYGPMLQGMGNVG